MALTFSADELKKRLDRRNGMIINYRLYTVQNDELNDAIMTECNKTCFPLSEEIRNTIVDSVLNGILYDNYEGYIHLDQATYDQILNTMFKKKEHYFNINNLTTDQSKLMTVQLTPDQLTELKVGITELFDDCCSSFKNYKDEIINDVINGVLIPTHYILFDGMAYKMMLDFMFGFRHVVYAKL